jgi:hypothetical protein
VNRSVVREHVEDAMEWCWPAFYVDDRGRGGCLMVRCSLGCKGGWQLLRWPASVALRTSLGRHVEWHARRGES